eukprot:jgi/Botrbrau1/21452/Bobra.0216s0060.1
MGIAASVLEMPLESPGRIMLVTAHPDDEAMFFVPVVQSLRSMKLHIMLLCLSDGNARGKGWTRAAELSLACKQLNIKFFKIARDARLQDGMKTVWDKRVIASIVVEEIWRCRIKTVITFDKRGMSGHPNHTAVYEGVRYMLSANNLAHIRVYAVESPSLLLKYSSFLSIPPLLMYTFCQKNVFGKDAACCISRCPWQSVAAMRMHQSQWNWYRKLFVLFASCTLVNMLQAL